jgi:hypothetical protein
MIKLTIAASIRVRIYHDNKSTVVLAFGDIRLQRIVIAHNIDAGLDHLNTIPVVIVDDEKTIKPRGNWVDRSRRDSLDTVEWKFGLHYTFESGPEVTRAILVQRYRSSQ